MKQGKAKQNLAQLREARLLYGITLLEIALEHAKQTRKPPVGVATVCNVLAERRTSNGIVEALRRCIVMKKAERGERVA